mmetsp:Transcript_23025/g.60143  ORF Transcript_23025/g.60143 Transcript_23025/m.60143 type:complete len:209 (+) Transcript_23025:165-791(+)
MAPPDPQRVVETLEASTVTFSYLAQGNSVYLWSASGIEIHAEVVPADAADLACMLVVAHDLVHRGYPWAAICFTAAAIDQLEPVQALAVDDDDPLEASQLRAVDRLMQGSLVFRVDEDPPNVDAVIEHLRDAPIQDAVRAVQEYAKAMPNSRDIVLKLCATHAARRELFSCEWDSRTAGAGATNEFATDFPAKRQAGTDCKSAAWASP